MKNKYFLWPENSIFRGIASSYKLVGTEQIENLLQNMFPSGYPVLCSSGRAAITLALEQSNVRRSDFVGLFPYASHCVIDAVARLSTPLSGPTAIKANYRIVYHQWGYVQEKNLPKNKIEDCVDTLCVKGTELFPGGGNFEVWSLPKILGTTSGGVLWCKHEKTAIDIRTRRDKSKGALLQWFLRLLSKNNHRIYQYWQGAESSSSNVSKFQTGEVLAAIMDWDKIVTDRIRKINLVWHLAPEWLPKPEKRLPPVVPVIYDIDEKKIFEKGLKSGFRIIEKLDNIDGVRKLIKVIPMPVHQSVLFSDLIELEYFFD